MNLTITKLSAELQEKLDQEHRALKRLQAKVEAEKEA